MGKRFEDRRLPFLPLSKEKQKLIRSLARRKERARRSLYLAEGYRLVEESVRTPESCRFLYGSQEQLQRLTTDLPCLVCEDPEIFLTENAQGIGALLEIDRLSSPRAFFSLEGPLLLLDALSDPGNAGTILRAADWCGISGVGFMKGSVDPWNPKAVRASMGALLRTSVITDLGLDDIVQSGRSLYALDAGGTIEVGRDRLDPAGLYVVGNEAHGISRALRDAASGLVRIPGVRGESLNAAMAATILLHELYRTVERGKE